MNQAKYIEVSAAARYWEDATLNGVSDEEGKIPCRRGDCWEPLIDLLSGKIINWTEGNEAKVHYKVCDAGEYWLLDENKQRIAKWKDYYVPDNILCIGSKGYGDYLIMNIDQTGQILGWKKPYIDEDEWEEVTSS